MTVERAFLTLMETIDPTAADRMFMLHGPQDPVLPVVVVLLVDDPAAYHLRGRNRSGRARVQLDVYAGERSGADAYGLASDFADTLDGDGAGSGLSGFRGHVGSSPAGMFLESVQQIDRQSLFEPDELRLVRIRLDYFAYYRRT